MPWKLLFMGTVFESKRAQSTHLSLQPISGVCLMLPIRNYACHLFLRRSHTSATCCQMLKFSGERSPQLNKLLFFSSFCLGLLMFLLLLVPAAIFFCSLSKQWLNPRLQSEASPSSPRELQQRQTDPACAKGSSRHLAQGGMGRMRGWRSEAHPTPWVGCPTAATNPPEGLTSPWSLKQQQFAPQPHLCCTPLYGFLPDPDYSREAPAMHKQISQLTLCRKVSEMWRGVAAKAASPGGWGEEYICQINLFQRERRCCW